MKTHGSGVDESHATATKLTATRALLVTKSENGFKEITQLLFPFNRAGWLGANVVNNAIDTSNLSHDA